MKTYKFFFVMVVLVVVFLMFFFAVVKPEFFAGPVRGADAQGVDVAELMVPGIVKDECVVAEMVGSMNHQAVITVKGGVMQQKSPVLAGVSLVSVQGEIL